ncbi:hybrid sensor histidine kinase/response regulator transcription factor [Parabacteroides sp. PF5-6]|uniref:hybrid sensor histidine kinase/response regulator transcription factor n=1 Tax=Parabacteroides sp. PF5-6 TaxID=1742403 RepID=UPI002404AEC0|nr:hybrid sensor histidine kinase/response regulator transcription factor [Parabacteroides sp. PF5-6]MDF9831711.1 ligand-binding sensor domain-containing protein/signal transduction histidine kinase/DNA-binding response OmpR family regulator [Parabacteroides sp. PF5-6]
MKFHTLLISLFFLFPANSIAQSSESFNFRHYTNKDGLSHNTVYHSIQDRRGFMWFATDDGLNRFDGQAFTVYRNNSWLQDNDGLLHDHILSLFEDSTGRIWICTEAGTCYYDYETNTFYSLRLLTGGSSEEYFDRVIEDNRKNLWFSNYTRVFRYNIETHEMNNYLSFNPISVTISEDGSPAFATVYDIYQYNPDADNFTVIPILTEEERVSDCHIQKIQVVEHGGYLIGTDRVGLKMYYQRNGKIETIIPDVHVRNIMQYRTNIYWIATESGLYIYNMIDKTITNLRKSLTNEYTISDNAVYSLTQDREGGVWLGTFFGGIDYLPSNQQNFKHYIGGRTHPEMLGNTVREIHRDKYGNLWLATEDNGINRFNPHTGEMVNFSANNPLRKLSATNIHGIYPKGDTLWVGTFNTGIDLLHIPTGKLIKRYDQTSTHGGINNFILCFAETSRNEFLIGTSVGVRIYDPKKDNFTSWHDVDGMVRQIFEDSQKRVWVATNIGLRKYDPSKKDPITYYGATEISATNGLGSNNTTSVFEDSKGRVWVTTAYGLSLYNEHTDSFNRITTQNGLPSNFVYRIVEDDHSNFWISTANGLVKFNPETHQIRTFTHKDGLHESQFNYSSSYKAEDGTIYMGTIDGMISFNPRTFKEDTYSPPLYITRVYVPDNPQKNMHIQASTTDTTYTLKLPYNTPTFALSYIAPSFTSPQSIRYSYMLEGFDKDWVEMGTTKEVTFANLSPGNYTFRVRSTNSSQVWQDNEQRMQIIITPPWWLTIWAYLFYLLLLISLAIVFYKYKKRQLIRRQQHNQHIFETEKEKELYNAKIQFFTFITHEIRTPLTLISAPLERIIRSEDGTEQTKKNLQIIQKNTYRLLDLSNQLLDFRKTESKGFRLNFVQTDVALWMETTLQRFAPVYTQEGKNVNIHIPNTHFLAYIDREAFVKILSNLLTNAMKYSHKDISITLNPPVDSEKRFSVVITNDGPLIPEDEKDHIFTPFYRAGENETKPGSGIGLSLCLSLTEFHKGTLHYQYSTEGLNQFTLALPTEQEEHCFETATESLEDMAIEVVAPPTNSGKPVVLIVEDQKDMRQFILDELVDRYDLLEAENGKIALEILESHTVNLIISDIVMPVMDGYELCNEVKNNVQYSHIPLILLTAQHNLQSRLKGLNQGADAYMEKPFSLDHLAAQIENLFKNRKTLYKSYLEKPYTPPTTLAMSPVDDLFLQKLNTYIEENLTNQSLNVEMIANEVGMSNSSLYRKVKGLSDLSPIDFIRIARLKKAVQMMQSGEKQVSEIAYQVGFSSPAYFSTCFQKQYGKSPSEFIREMKDGGASH